MNQGAINSKPTFSCFEIPFKLPSLNEYITANRTNPHKGARFKKDIEQRIAWTINSAHMRPVRKPCIVSMTFVEGDRRRDVDNVESAKKYILDALVTTGILKCDGPKYVIGAPSYTIYARGAKVLVCIVECEDEEVLRQMLRDAMEQYSE